MENILKDILTKFNLDRVQVCTIEKDPYTGLRIISFVKKVASDTILAYDKVNHKPDITCTTHRYQEVLLEIFRKGSYFCDSALLNKAPSSSQQFLESLTKKANIGSINAYKIDDSHFLSLHYCNREKSKRIPRHQLTKYIDLIRKLTS